MVLGHVTLGVLGHVPLGVPDHVPLGLYCGLEWLGRGEYGTQPSIKFGKTFFLKVSRKNKRPTHLQEPGCGT